MKGEIFKDVRVVALILLVLASIIAIHPVYSTTPEPHFDSNLNYGLDLVGGTTIQLELEGVLVKADFDRDTLLKSEMERLLGEEIIIISSNEEAIVFTTSAEVSQAQINRFGFGEVMVSQLGEETQVEIETSSEAVMKIFLQNRFDTEVIYRTFKGVEVYEIREEIEKEDLESLLAEVGATIAVDEDGNPIYIKGVTPKTLTFTKQVIDDKLNTIGLKDIHTRTVGERYLIVDLPGVDIETAREIVGKPGKFEIRIQTMGAGGDIERGMLIDEIESITAHVFYGDCGIVSVDPLPTKSGYDEDSPWAASFHLTLEGGGTLQRAAIDYGAVTDPINHEVVMLLDDKVIYSAPFSDQLAMNIAEAPVYSLQASTGVGEEGFSDAQVLIVHLSAGALPVNVKIIGTSSISAPLGEKFKVQTAIAGILAVLVVGLVIYLRYRQPKIVLPMIATMLSEVVVLLGFAAFVNWQLDLASIAGIIAVIGTSIDHLVIITDEVLGGWDIPTTGLFLSRLKGAFAIIFAAAATTVIAMSPLVWMGFGALKGFAFIIIVGVMIGVLVARPAYGRIIQDIL